MIKVKNITKIYGNTTAVDDISFEIDKGEITGFLGPNGAGKSTLLRIMTGVLSPTSGSVEIAGHDIHEEPIAAKRMIGYLPENNPLYPDYTARAYLSFIANLKNIQDVNSEIDRVMKAVFIADKAENRIVKLSKGYRQRVGMAAALLGNPEILLLDEPTVGLDPNQIVEIRELIREIGKTNTILLSTHILQEVNSVCNKVIIIHKGKIRAIDTHEHLLDRIEGQNKIQIQSRNISQETIRQLEKIDGVTKIETRIVSDHQTEIDIMTKKTSELRPLIAKTIIMSGGDLFGMKVETLSLEEVFMKLTNERDPEGLS